MQKLMVAVLCVPLIAATAMASPGQNGYHNQYQDNRGYNQYQGNRGYNNNRGDNQYRDDRGYNHYRYDRESHQQFYNGAYEGGRGGDYGYDHDGRYAEYDRHYHGNGNYYGDPTYYRHDNGIGPGKGALIGGAGGAVLGALLGGGKGAFVGGAAGAGIGAILGEHSQQERREQPY